MTKIEVQKVKVPDPLLICEEDPLIPEAPVEPEAYITYIFDLWEAGEDCRSKLRAIREWNDRP